MIDWIVSSSVLLAVVLLVRQILKDRISSRLRYALWMVVLVRLLVPFQLGESTLSVMNPVSQVPVVQTVEQVRDVEVIRHGADGAVTGYFDYDPMGDAPAVLIPQATPQEFHRMEQILSAREILTGVWLMGMGVMALVFMASNLRFSRKLLRTRQLMEQEELPLAVYRCDAVETPCLFGLFRPAVYVTSEAAEDPVVLRHALAHEYTHYRQGDHVWALLRCLCLTLHWYHPLVWAAALLSRQDGELSCDEGTIRRLGEGERAAYGRTLIRLTCEKRGGWLNTATTMTGSANKIRERITLLAKHPRTALATLVALVLVTAAAVGCTFTGAGAPTAQDEGMTLYPCGEVTAAIPTEYLDNLIVETGDGSDGTLLTIWEKKSLEQARAAGEELPEQWGWIATLERHDRAGLEQSIREGWIETGLTFFGTDGESYYALVEPTDVRLYRGEWDQIGAPDENTMTEWNRANESIRSFRPDFLRRNGLQAFDVRALYEGELYEGDHRYYLCYAPGFENDGAILMLSQPAKQGPGGIWCVEQYWDFYNYHGIWFPYSDIPAADYYLAVQKEQDAGTRRDHATPEAAIDTFLRQCKSFYGGEDPERMALQEVPALPSVEEMMGELQPEDLRQLYRTGGWITGIQRETVAQALRTAVTHPARQQYPLEPLWTIGTRLSNGSLGEVPQLRFLPELTISCGLEEDLVEITVRCGPMRSRLVCDDPALYDLVRNQVDRAEDVVDAEAVRRFQDRLEPEMEQALEQMNRQLGGGLTGYHLTQFHPVYHWQEADGVHVTLYSFDFALEGDELLPELLDAGMYLDGEQNLRGFYRKNRDVVVREREGKTVFAFLPWEFVARQPEEFQKEESWLRYLLSTALNRAEALEQEVLHVEESRTFPSSQYDRGHIFQDVAGGPVELTFCTDQQLTKVQWFAVEHGEAGTLYRGETLYTLPEALTPSCYFSVETDLGGVLPTRGIAYRQGGSEQAFAVTISGEDGSPLLIPMT